MPPRNQQLIPPYNISILTLEDQSKGRKENQSLHHDKSDQLSLLIFLPASKDRKEL